MTSDRIGYRQPPKHSRFRKGRSGNPSGRPKGQPNLSTELAEELGERISVREGGKSRRVSKQRALLKALIAKGLQGDVKAMTAVLTLGARAIDQDNPNNAPLIHEQEIEVLKHFLPDLMNSLEKKAKRHGH